MSIQYPDFQISLILIVINVKLAFLIIIQGVSEKLIFCDLIIGPILIQISTACVETILNSV